MQVSSHLAPFTAAVLNLPTNNQHRLTSLFPLPFIASLTSRHLGLCFGSHATNVCEELSAETWSTASSASAEASKIDLVLNDTVASACCVSVGRADQSGLPTCFTEYLIRTPLSHPGGREATRAWQGGSWKTHLRTWPTYIFVNAI